MKCENCSETILSNMKGSIRNNLCPFCGQNVMLPAKAEQYNNLVELLDKTTFTNRVDIDNQIKEKVASLMITNFIFKRLVLEDQEQDIVVVPDTPNVSDKQVIQPEKKTKKTKEIKQNLQKVDSHGRLMNAVTEQEALKNASVRSPTSKKKPKLPETPSSGFSMKDYVNIQNQMYESDDDDQSISNMSAEEIKQMFPDMSSDEIQEAIKVERQCVSTVGSGKGIRRL